MCKLYCNVDTAVQAVQLLGSADADACGPPNLVCGWQEGRKLSKGEPRYTWFCGSNSYSCQTIMLLVPELA